MEKLRKYVRGKAQPEHSIADAYIANEAQRFCSMYCRGIDAQYTRDEENSNVGQVKKRGTLSLFSQRAQPFGREGSVKLSKPEVETAQFYVLGRCRELEPYKE